MVTMIANFVYIRVPNSFSVEASGNIFKVFFSTCPKPFVRLFNFTSEGAGVG